MMRASGQEKPIFMAEIIPQVGWLKNGRSEQVGK